MALLRSRSDEQMMPDLRHAQPLLSIENLEFRYGAVPALLGVSAQINPGEMIALVGPNGAGKSTLMSLLAGLSRPSRGRILIESEDVTGMTRAQLLKRGVVLVPENKAIFPDMTVAENLEMAAYTLTDSQAAERTEVLFGVFTRLRERLKQRAGTMSCGERQMLSIARAVLLTPRLLLIDELTLGLAPIIVDGLLQSIQDLNRAGTTVLMVEQSLNVAASVCERALFMEKGRIVFEGPTAHLLDRPELAKAVLFGGHLGSEG